MKTDNVRRQPAGWFDEYRPGVEQKWFDFGRAEIWLGIKSELVCRNTGIYCVRCRWRRNTGVESGIPYVKSCWVEKIYRRE